MVDLDAIVHAICADPPGYIVDDEETPWPPTDPHMVDAGAHLHDMRCAICRARDRPEALRALVQAVIDCLPDHALAAIAERQPKPEQSGRKDPA